MGKFSDHSEYFNKDNVEVPSVTTILKILAKPFLSKWANIMGFKRQRIEDILEEKSEIGTTLHFLIEKYLKKETVVFTGGRYTGRTLMLMLMNQFLNWYKQHEVEPILLEHKMSCDKFGGTVDFYGKVDGKFTVIDFKTSKKVYGNMFLQISAYVYMLEQQGYQVDQVAILAINTNKFMYKTMDRENLDKYIKTFTILVDLFENWYTISNEDKWGDII